VLIVSWRGSFNTGNFVALHYVARGSPPQRAKQKNRLVGDPRAFGRAEGIYLFHFPALAPQRGERLGGRTGLLSIVLTRLSTPSASLGVSL